MTPRSPSAPFPARGSGPGAKTPPRPCSPPPVDRAVSASSAELCAPGRVQNSWSAVGPGAQRGDRFWRPFAQRGLFAGLVAGRHLVSQPPFLIFPRRQPHPPPSVPGTLTLSPRCLPHLCPPRHCPQRRPFPGAPVQPQPGTWVPGSTGAMRELCAETGSGCDLQLPPTATHTSALQALPALVPTMVLSLHFSWLQQRGQHRPVPPSLPLVLHS